MRSNSTGRQWSGDVGSSGLFSTHLAYYFHCSYADSVVCGNGTSAAEQKLLLCLCKLCQVSALLLPSLARTLVLCLAVLRIDMYNAYNVRPTVGDVQSNWNMVWHLSDHQQRVIIHTVHHACTASCIHLLGDESCSSTCEPVNDLYRHNILLGWAHEQKEHGFTLSRCCR